ncbi:MAG: YbgC/FadM family acyl-CoA thioesterase [Paracoccaceae bacterium]
MFQYNCEVFYEDTDMGGRVYHANYLKFIERARSKFIESLNVDQRVLLLEEKKIFIVKNIVADYLLPAHFGDRLEIYTTLIELKRASMILKQEILRDNKKIFKGNVRLALLNSSGKPEKFSMDLASNIKNFLNLFKKMGD